jgi:TonB family protein
METTMMRFKSTELPLLIPLALLLGAAVTKADASWFQDKTTGISRNVGSAANPTPADLILISRGPDYPVRSRMFKEEGTVGLNVWLSETGRVDNAWVEHSSGYPRLDDAAVRFMRDRWHYKPANKDLPMPKNVQTEVTFKLD